MLLELFLSVYEDGSWGGNLSCREYPERVRDHGVELVATQLATGRTLAIEHTIIDVFVGEEEGSLRELLGACTSAPPTSR